VFQEVDSWSGIVGLVISGNSHVGVGEIAVTKERSEIVAYTNNVGFRR
jgi:hypothetical protein